MLLRIATAVGFTLALAGLVYVLTNQRGLSAKASLPSALRVGCLTLGASAWLALASTALIWLFPLNVVATAAVGYFGTRSAMAAVPAPEVKAFAILAAVSGVAIAAAVATSGDPFMLHVAGPYSLLNTVTMAGAAYIAMRPRRGVA
jgi:hypothetical protein